MHLLKKNLQPIIAAIFALTITVFFTIDLKFIHSLQHQLNSDFTRSLPYFLFGATGVLGFRLNQKRILFISLFFIANYFFFSHTAGLEFLSFRSKSQIFSICAPLSLSALFFVKEKKLTSFSSLAAVGLILLPPALFSAAIFFKWNTFLSIVLWHFSSNYGFTIIPDAAICLFIFFFIIGRFITDRYLRTFHSFVSASLLPIFFILERMKFTSFDRAVAFTSSGTLLAYAIFRLYWQKIYIDELTGISNRRALNERLPLLGQNYTIAMVDIDHFKKFNDTYGHDEGDNVLRFVAKYLDETTNGNVYRYGGEEFTIIYENCTTDDVFPTVDAIRRKLAEKKFYIRSPKSIRSKTTSKDRKKAAPEPIQNNIQVTISVGIAGSADAPRNLEEIFKAADEALYKSKEKGRNCVTKA